MNKELRIGNQESGVNIVHVIVSPFATAGTVLLLILSLLEYLRPRSVTLFLDFRIVAGVALVLWIVAICTEDVAEPPNRFWPSLLVVITFAIAAPVLYKLIAPFGRLGLITLIAGLLTFIIIISASLKRVTPDS